jgi:hypothetical protein
MWLEIQKSQICVSHTIFLPGAYFEVSFKGSWAGMKIMIESMIEFNKGNSELSVLYYISRIAKDKLQIILRDSDNYIGQSVGLAHDLKKEFDTGAYLAAF